MANRYTLTVTPPRRDGVLSLVARGVADTVLPVSAVRGWVYPQPLQVAAIHAPTMRNRLALAVVRPTFTGRADVRGNMREQARALLARLDAQAKGKHWDRGTQAHLADCADTLRQALSATIQRQAL